MHEHALRDHLRAARHGSFGGQRGFCARRLSGSRADLDYVFVGAAQVREDARLVLEATLLQHEPLDFVDAGTLELAQRDGQIEARLVSALAEAAEIRRG
jgi:hypothetical protein